jgi:hypothetical protein
MKTRSARREEVLARLKAALPQQKQKEVAQDLEIIIRRVELNFRLQEYQRAHDVPFSNASSLVLRRSDAARRATGGATSGCSDSPAAVCRARSRLQAAHRNFKQRVMEQMAAGCGLFGGSNRDRDVAKLPLPDGIASLCKEYKLSGWEEPFAAEAQLIDYDAWIRSTVLPKARADFRLPPEEYALSLSYGIDIPPTQMAALAHKGRRDSGRDEADRCRDRQAAQAAIERLSRRHS